MSVKRKRYLSRRYKLLIPLMSLSAVMFVFGYFGAQNYLRDTIYEIMRDDTDDIRAYVEGCLDEDQLQAITSGAVSYDESAGWPNDMTDQRFWDAADCLASVEDFNPRTEIFTYYQTSNSSLAFGVDQWVVLQPEDSYLLGEEIIQDEDYGYLLQGLQEITYYDELNYSEEDDTYFFAVTSPLLNSQGAVIGGLTIYLDAGFAVDSLQSLSDILAIIFVVIFIIVAVLVLSITHNVTAELIDLQNSAKRAANGDYAPITLNPENLDDEVSVLEEQFNLMLNKVRQREEKLKKQVEALTIQIDMEKRSKDVKEIVESEFFQDLKNRAATVRKQREQKS